MDRVDCENLTCHQQKTSECFPKSQELTAEYKSYKSQTLRLYNLKKGKKFPLTSTIEVEQSNKHFKTTNSQNSIIYNVRWFKFFMHC